jgi:hypothetical protein
MNMSDIEANSYNLQSKTRFILSLPIDQIIGEYESTKNFKLNVYGFATPEISAGFGSVKYQGYEVPIPNGNRVEEKLLSVRFLVSENLIQYAVMLAWINKITFGGTKIEASDLLKDSLTGNLWMLDAFLKPRIPIKYEGMCIARLGQLVGDQSDQSAAPLSCDASFRYIRSDLDVMKIIAG